MAQCFCQSAFCAAALCFVFALSLLGAGRFLVSLLGNAALCRGAILLSSQGTELGASRISPTWTWCCAPCCAHAKCGWHSPSATRAGSHSWHRDQQCGLVWRAERPCFAGRAPALRMLTRARSWCTCRPHTESKHSWSNNGPSAHHTSLTASSVHLGDLVLPLPLLPA